MNVVLRHFPRNTKLTLHLGFLHKYSIENLNNPIRIGS